MTGRGLFICCMCHEEEMCTIDGASHTGMCDNCVGMMNQLDHPEEAQQ